MTSGAKLTFAWIAFAVIAVLFWLFIRGGVMESDVVSKIAVAIATAEGFYVTNSRAQRNHNPGNMRADLTGKSVGVDADGFVQYATDDDGWDNLKKQVSLFFTGPSHFNPNQTIQEVANIYTSTAQSEWATIVATELGVSTDTQLKDIA